MWNKIQDYSPVFYFDATGGLFKRIKNQKAPNWYSMCCHDKKNNKIVPVFEFITTDQPTNNLSIYLKKAGFFWI